MMKTIVTYIVSHLMKKKLNQIFSMRTCFLPLYTTNALSCSYSNLYDFYYILKPNVKRLYKMSILKPKHKHYGQGRKSVFFN